MTWLFLFLHLFLFHFPSFSSSLNFSCHHDESSALLQFKSSFTLSSSDSCYGYDEPNHMKTTTWKNGTDCCSWNGVTCDTIYGHVIGLNLGCEGLEGKLHPNSTLYHLIHLQTLNLSNNDFSNSHFDCKFGGFQSLTHLDLSNSYFEGEIPTQISHLSKLKSLHLSESGGLVWKEITLKKLLQNTTNLRELILDETDMSLIRPNSIALLFNQSSSLVTLNLHNTRLSGKLKRSLLCLPSIQELYMSSFFLEGQLPELSCSTSLRILDLSYCSFNGEIPTMSFSNLTHLTSLSLSGNHLNGSIPSSLLTLPRLTFLYLNDNELSGRIPNAFLMSNRFQKLDFSENKIEGELPSSLSNLQHLIQLYLSFNSFSGQISDVFGGMTKLQYLFLQSNKLQGQIPSSLFNLTQLVTLYCRRNKLEGPLPNKITGFQKLTDLRLNDNLLNGTIPSSLLSLPSLEILDLSNNRLSGHISEISSNSLIQLSLSNNRLQGNIPESISNLTNLEYLDLSSNNLSGVDDFQHFSKLQNLDSLSSVYLTEFPKLSGKLYYLDLSNNKLNGNIPKSIFNLANLIELDLSSNNLSGVVDFQHFSKLQNLDSLSLSHNSQLSLTFESNVNYNFSRLSKLDLSSINLTEFPIVPSLVSLDLSNNKLSLNLLVGDLSVSICNMSSLQLLNLAHNQLTGIIPQCLADSSSLQVLDLQMNKFHGTLPSNFSKECALQTLNLYGNQLEGHFPKSLSHCKKLEFLNLGSNKIDDNFPDWLQTLQNLEVLVLQNNKLHGIIANLKIEHPFPGLIIFDISGNNFSGPLPKAYLKKFEAMKNVTGLKYMMNDVYHVYHFNRVIGSREISRYYDSVSVATKGIKRTLVKVPNIFVIIDLSGNKFEGEIPNVIGELHALVGLNLSHNRLSGPIPQSMGNLTNLEWLDLSSNMFTHKIPAELINLGFLEVLDLSNNHLVGEIPQGKQFGTFLNDSYEGNTGLCGFPLSNNCGPEHHSPPSPNNTFWSEEKFGFGWKPVAIGYGCGFLIGIGIGYYMFLIGKPRWLVMIFGGQPKRRMKRRTRMSRNHNTTMNQNQMVQMS